MTVARRYAKAALAVAQQDAATVPQFNNAVALLAEALAGPSLASVLNDASLNGAQRQQLATTCAKAVKAPKALANLLQVLANNGRLALLPEVLRAIQQEAASAAGIAELLVHSAKPLSDAQKISLKVQVKTYAKAKDVRLTEVVKPELLGGFRAFFGGLVWDTSVQGGLARLRANLQQAIQ